MKTKETNPTRPGSPTPCKQALSPELQEANKLLQLTKPISSRGSALLKRRQQLTFVKSKETSTCPLLFDFRRSKSISSEKNEIVFEKTSVIMLFILACIGFKGTVSLYV